MSLVMSKEMKQELNDVGFVVIPNVLSQEELSAISGSLDELATADDGDALAYGGKGYSRRNGLVASEGILNLIDHPIALKYIVDAIGWNIFNRDSVISVIPPQPKSESETLALGWHFDYEEEICGMTVDGTLPLIDFKIGWYISDHRDPLHATILLVPGSHKWSIEQRATWENWYDMSKIVELRVAAGTILLWRPSILHSVTPNMSTSVRKAIYASYCPRWIRPTGYIRQDPDLVLRSDPVRRQLLGEMGDGSNPLGKNPNGAPNSQFWFTEDWNSLPLKKWAEERSIDGKFDWGTELGVSHTKGPDFSFTQLDVPKEPRKKLA